MQCEMEPGMSGAKRRRVARLRPRLRAGATEVAALADRAKQATRTEHQVQDALALREVRVMTSYRPRLLRAGTAAARIRSDVFSVLAQMGRRSDTEGGPIGEREIFWDGIGLTSSL